MSFSFYSPFYLLHGSMYGFLYKIEVSILLLLEYVLGVKVVMVLG